MSSALPSSLRRLAVAAGAALTALAVSVVLAVPASAHVTVFSDDAAPGGFGKVTFRVPNESDTARTVAVRIRIAPETPLAFLQLQPVPGWTATTTTSELPEPVDVEGQRISTYVSVVEFRAEDGGGIGPGQFQEFALAGGPFPDAAELVFATVQTYSDGTEAAWIEPTVEGQPEPERPAPVLTFGPDTAVSSGGGGTSGTEPASRGTDGGNTATEPATEPAAESAASSGDGSGAATVALVLSVLALALGLAGVLLGLRARRTVSS